MGPSRGVADCARRSPDEATEDPGSIPGTSTGSTIVRTIASEAVAAGRAATASVFAGVVSLVAGGWGMRKTGMMVAGPVILTSATRASMSALRWAGLPERRMSPMGLPRGDLSLQAGHQELLVAPRFGAGPFSEALDGLAQRGCLQRPGQKRHLGAQVPGRPCAGSGAHRDASRSRSRSARVTGSPQSGHAPPSPRARPNRPQPAQRCTPSWRAPQSGHS